MEKVDRIMAFLQRRCGGHHSGGTWRLRPYVSEYLTRMITSGASSIQIVTLWCLTRRLEKRFRSDGNLLLLPSELKVVAEIDAIIGYFQEEGFSVDWYVLLAGSAVTSGQINASVAGAYNQALAVAFEGMTMCALEVVPHFEPDPALVSRISSLVPHEALERERMRRTHLYAERGIVADTCSIAADLRRSIAVKAQEGQWLVETFGDFLLLPVEYPERYVFHELLAPGLMQRICPTLTPYPWRGNR